MVKKNKVSKQQHHQKMDTSAASGITSSVGVFALLFIVSILSALYNRIIDCDEYMNYWEPTHFLMYNKGFQTWEYSPTYSLRSYAYLLIHSSIGKLLEFISNGNKATLFFLIKISIGLLSSLSQTVFYNGIKKRFGESIANYTLVFMLLSPAFFLSTTTYLPTTFSMTALMAGYGCWMLDYSFASVLFCCVSVFLGWPFVGVLCIPLGLNVLYHRGLLKMIGYLVSSVLLVFVPMVAIDYRYYGKLVIAILNIVAYNFTDDHSGGSQLYGIESWTFYFINAFVNFNVVFVMSCLTLPLVVMFYKYKWSKASLGYSLLVLMPYYLWFSFMTYLPHKEERFLFVVYPFICLAGAVSLSYVLNIIESTINWMFGKGGKGLSRFLCFSFILVFSLLSVSRIYSTYVNYTAPIDLFVYLNNNVLNNGNLTPSSSSTSKQDIDICVGKEWHRFPSNYFIPNDNQHFNFNLRFIESEFKGHLPKPFSTHPNATSIIPSNMNDQNKQEFDRYIKEEDCDYLIDFDSPSQKEVHYVDDTLRWKIIYSLPFLDISQTHSPLRAFFIPFYSKNINHYSPYYILKNIEK
ncbi:hypothetical protein CYY_001442 [Polysphondylium violaceum]|uniref:Mannosyltransferase n=1 Tax=Polysphondylium violaceum TaxID=133409 RepID=A0A8J4PY76_9MYCE|nr:hypothetical protein CYY_001442 [Polysphondylium violaceum]